MFLSTLKQSFLVLFNHTPKWWASLVIAAIGGYGLFAANADWRQTYNAWAAERMMPPIPLDEPVLWLWLVMLALLLFCWIIVSLFTSEVRRRLITPRLFFSGPYIHHTPIATMELGMVIDTIDMVRVSVRNQPISMENGRPVEDAHATAEFFDLATGSLAKRVRYLRWTDNPKPRPDELDKPKFIDEHKYRNLRANNSNNDIDIAIKSYKKKELYGFNGPSQSKADWQDASLFLPEKSYKVRVIIEGRGMPKPSSEWFYLNNKNADGPPEVGLLAHRGWQNWVGAG